VPKTKDLTLTITSKVSFQTLFFYINFGHAYKIIDFWWYLFLWFVVFNNFVVLDLKFRDLFYIKL